jgi:hypothetical protein
MSLHLLILNKEYSIHKRKLLKMEMKWVRNVAHVGDAKGRYIFVEKLQRKRPVFTDPINEEKGKNVGMKMDKK